jgi:hypothetical protein
MNLTEETRERLHLVIFSSLIQLQIIITRNYYIQKFCSDEIKKLLPTSPGTCLIFK